MGVIIFIGLISEGNKKREREKVCIYRRKKDFELIIYLM